MKPCNFIKLFEYQCGYHRKIKGQLNQLCFNFNFILNWISLTIHFHILSYQEIEEQSRSTETEVKFMLAFKHIF